MRIMNVKGDEPGIFWTQLNTKWFVVSIGNGRTHHPEMAAGVWKLCRNGVQFFVGRTMLTVNWEKRGESNG